MRHLSILFVCAVVLSGCAAGPAEPPAGQALLSAILPPSSLGHPLVSSQLMDLDVGGETMTFQIELELTPARLAMVVLTTYGAPAFTLEQDARDVSVQTFGADAFPIDPRYVLSDFQLSRWPMAVLREPLEDQGFVLREIDGMRTVFNGLGVRLVEIAVPQSAGSAMPGKSTIRHFDPAYRASIRPIGTGADR